MSLEIPTTWLDLKLGDVINYGKTEKIEPDEIADDYWVLELEDIEKDSSRLLQKITYAERHSKSTKNKFKKGDVLYGKLRPYLNKVLIADQDGCCTTEIIPIKSNDAVNGRYLYYWLKHPKFLDYVSDVSHGINMPRLGTDAGKAAPFVLAPLKEQKRIAAKLDTLLATVDACRSRLDKVPTVIKRFRQSVLAAATSGELTEDWRDQNKIDFNWPNANLKDIGEFGRGKSKHRPRNDKILFGGAYPFIQTGDVANSDGLITKHSNNYSEMGLQQSKLWPSQTLCITIAANIANTALLTYPACFPDSIVGFAANPTKSLPLFVKFAIDVIKNDLESYAPATAQKNINLAILGDIVFKCPSLPEQQEIVRRVEALFAIADKLEAKLTVARKRVDQLTPAILAQAFRGDLVAQDPSDEPASALLERVANPVATKHELKKAA